MIEKISQYIVNNILLKDENTNDNEKDIMFFGVTRILEDIPKFVGIFYICYLLNILNELGVVFVVTICYKIFIGGAHARTNMQCFIVSLIYFVLPIMAAKYINYSLNLFYIIYILTILFSIYIIIKIAPADTEEIPIINKKKRKNLKHIGSISLVLINILTVLFIKDVTYMKIIVYTILLINIFATPLMYKLLGCKLGIESEEYGKFY
ncbi:MAG: accessory gene regulator B family protein [Clostridia bacterium]|nr:accessory gene regulator B family protein [Clostridia bacterium]MDD4387161.1 accessory gene regulator B family protein [Clostridia bacterium]